MLDEGPISTQVRVAAVADVAHVAGRLASRLDPKLLLTLLEHLGGSGEPFPSKVVGLTLQTMIAMVPFYGVPRGREGDFLMQNTV